MMEKNKKKRYEKPKVTRINLDVRAAVLGFCKTTGSGGPGTLSGCSPLGSPCLTQGS